MNGWRQDFRAAVRGLGRDRVFTVSAVLTLSLGVGAMTALAAVVAGVLLAPLPYARPDRLVAILHGRSVNAPVAPADFADIRLGARSFSEVAAAQAWGANLSAGGQTERVPALQVSGSLFRLLGVPPLSGRTVTAADADGNARVAVIAHRLWVRRFGADPSIVGRGLLVNGEPYTVIGVMPPSFRFAPFWQTRAELWVPLALADRASDRTGRSLRLFGRLADGVTLEEARAELTVINARLVRDWPGSHTGLTTGAMRLADKALGPVRPIVLAMTGLAAGLLLVSIVNLAMLVVSRLAARQHEFAVRAAIGASDARLTRGALVEGLLVAALGAGGGALSAMAGTLLLARVLPADSLPPHADLQVSPAVLGLSLALSALAAVLATALPAWRLTRRSAAGALQPARTATGTPGARRARAVLVGVEVTLAFALAVMAALFARSVANLQRVDLGFVPDRLVAMSVSLDGALHDTPESRTAFFGALAAKLAAVPGVERAGAINHLPLAGDLWTLSYAVDGRPPAAPGQEDAAAYRVVLPGYFDTMRQPMRAGRDFTDADRAGAVIVNEHLARRQWPGGQAIGQRIRFDGAVLTVVGVVADVPQATLVDPIEDEIYLPLAQRPIQSATRSPMTMVVRAGADIDLAGPLRAAVWDLDRQAAVYDVVALGEVVASEMWRERLGARVGGLFASVAVVLAVLGIAGVVRYGVTRRWREFGIRCALGATRRHVVALAMREAAAPVVCGLVAGVALVLAAGRLVAALLVGVTPHDPMALAGTALGLLAAALLASWRPAVRASRVDPGMTLRDS